MGMGKVVSVPFYSSVEWPQFKKYLEEYSSHNAGQVATLCSQLRSVQGQGIPPAGCGVLHDAANLVMSSCLCKRILTVATLLVSLIQFLINKLHCTIAKQPNVSSVSRLRTSCLGAVIVHSRLKRSSWAPRSRSVQAIWFSQRANLLLQLQAWWYACMPDYLIQVLVNSNYHFMMFTNLFFFWHQLLQMVVSSVSRWRLSWYAFHWNMSWIPPRRSASSMRSPAVCLKSYAL